MHIAIIGMGPAAISAVKAIRNKDKQVKITMFSAEDSPPYSPPCLGNFLLTSDTKALFWQGLDFAERYNVHTQLGDPVEQVLSKEKKLITQKSNEFYYDKMIISSGSSLYSPVPGSEKPGVTQFKNLAGAQSLREKILQQRKTKAVIVGGGFIGVEIALYLAKLGVRPYLLNRRGWIMPRLLDPETALYVQNDLQDQGVNVYLNTEGVEFVGNNNVEYLFANNGDKLKADVYIAATGIKPNIDFLKNTNIKTENGIVVNSYLQTNDPNIFACGDVAQAPELITGKKLNLGLYPIAIKQGEIAGKNILGEELEYQPQPNMNSLKGLSFKLIVAGTQKGKEFVYKGKNFLRKFFIEHQKLQGFVLLGDISNAGTFMNILQQQFLLSPFRKYLENPNIISTLSNFR